MSSTDEGRNPLPIENDAQFTTRAWAIIVGWTTAVVLVAILMGLLAVFF